MVNNEKHIIISILKKLLYAPKKEYEKMTQYEFNCPSEYCKHDHNKYNLGFSTEKNIFRCWKCNYKGIVHRVVEDYGSPQDVELLESILPRKVQTKLLSELNSKRKGTSLSDDVVCELPEGFRPLYGKSYSSKHYYAALDYLKERKISNEIIKKYNIGYTESGPRKYRIVIPSYNINNDVNYYEARSYYGWVKPSYHKPENPHKSDIIFNAYNVNFDLPVYLVEGVFDMFPLYNAVPLLGKDLSDLLLSKFIKHKTKVILCLDEDALVDSIKIYNLLTELGIDAYFVEVKDDIDEYYKNYGKEQLVKLLKTYKKPDFKYYYNLILKTKKKKLNYDEKYLRKELEKIKKA